MPELILPVLGLGDEQTSPTTVTWRDGTIVCRGYRGILGGFEPEPEPERPDMCRSMNGETGMSLFEKGRFKTGGRAKGAKNRLSHAFLTALAEDFEQHGIDALKITRIERPVEYIKVVAGLMPKELEIMDSRLTDLSDEELDVFIAKLRAQLRSPVVTDAGDGEGTQTHH